MHKSVVVPIFIIAVASARNVPELWSEGVLVGRQCATSSVQKVYQIGDGVSAPVLLTKIEPVYTEEGRRLKREGNVVLLSVVDETGHTCNSRVAQSLGLGLEQAAVAAVSQWRFEPGFRNGKPVSVQGRIEVVFSLKKDLRNNNRPR